MAEDESTQQLDGASATGENKRGGFESFTVTGFSIICAWHFLALFSSVPTAGEATSAGRPLACQLALYLSLAASYFAAALGATRTQRTLSAKGASGWRRLALGAGFFATGASAFVILAGSHAFALSLCAWVVLGLSEVTLMLPWLQQAGLTDANKSTYRNLAFNMGLGAGIAFIAGNLFSPYGEIVFCALPLLSSVLPARYAETSEPASQAANGDRKETLRGSEMLKENVNFVCCGLVFGACQAVFSAAARALDTVSYGTGSSWPIVGCLISALVILVIRDNESPSRMIVHVQRFSSFLFTVGVMVSFYFVSSRNALDQAVYAAGDTIGQMLSLSGFNCFDFGFMVVALSAAALTKRDHVEFAGMNRCAVYLSMAVGLAGGSVAQTAAALVLPNSLTAIVAILVAVLAASALSTHERAANAPQADTEAQTQDPAHVDTHIEKPIELEADERTARIESLAEISHLSNREKQVFSMLANGMNANDIQQELWISIHTVKTHISNIYRKLDVHSAHELIALVDAEAGADALRERLGHETDDHQ